MDYTISETYSLPSKGLIYATPINPRISLRSMTTEEEMKRQSHSDTPYKVMCDIISDCILGDKIPVYDLCLSDYQYLLHKLRVVTYGPDYSFVIKCPTCGAVQELSLNLDDLEVVEYDEESMKSKLDGLLNLDLPMSKHKVTLSIQTPRMLDNIELNIKEFKRKNKDSMVDRTLSYTLMELINSVDGRVLSLPQKEAFVKKLPMKDANIIIQASQKAADMFGVVANVETDCKECGGHIVTPFRFTTEFFRPTINF